MDMYKETERYLVVNIAVGIVRMDNCMVSEQVEVEHKEGLSN